MKHYFYARGSYERAVPPGRYQVEVVRGIAHEAVVAYTEVGSGTTHVHDLEIPVLRDLQAGRWYSGNTHTHYHLELGEIATGSIDHHTGGPWTFIPKALISPIKEEAALLASLRSESEKGRIVAAIRAQVEKKVMQGRRNIVFTTCCHRHVWRKVVTAPPNIWAIRPNHHATLTVGNIRR